MDDPKLKSNSARTAMGVHERVSAAASPVQGTTIYTDAQGLAVGETSVSSAGFEVPVYFAKPGSGGSLHPVLLVVSEVFGVHAHIADVCRRFAKLGYLALAPDLFARHGDASAYQTLPELMREVVSRTADTQVIADLDAVAAHVGVLGGDVGRLGVTGFCWGGRITWLYAAHNAGVKAGVAWYGRLDGDVTDCTPAHPVSVASRLYAPVLGLYGRTGPDRAGGASERDARRT
ncbi:MULTISPECIES: dienelactone hydrolase family protein [Mycetohabitans]|uniref:Carboxymethylenebutenolidase n=1 Tax=Mycetohabitans endofungorum TaxID=417203 RepID=A0A2P5K6Y7_9BURK|nr:MULTISPECIES: dienelactone hydrolase family protein [Mycetohabitans]PPB81421.1 carboxymethylenebutenolidase [Mycetohabitans endofungorum]